MEAFLAYHALNAHLQRPHPYKPGWRAVFAKILLVLLRHGKESVVDEVSAMDVDLPFFIHSAKAVNWPKKKIFKKT